MKISSTKDIGDFEGCASGRFEVFRILEKILLNLSRVRDLRHNLLQGAPSAVPTDPIAVRRN